MPPPLFVFRDKLSSISMCLLRMASLSRPLFLKSIVGGMSACLEERDDDVCIFLWRVGERRESSLLTRTRSLFVVSV